MIPSSSQQWVNELMLAPHPEGGYYKEIYRSSTDVQLEGFIGKRNICTGIYYLLEDSDFSGFHRIKSDEIWHFYSGNSSLEIFCITKSGELLIQTLGLNVDKNERPFVLIEANTWFAARVINKKGFVLCGCTVSPGFDFSDFEMADKNNLLSVYLNQSDIIKELCR